MSGQLNVLVLGATGKTGMPVVEKALGVGLGVRAVIRAKTNGPSWCRDRLAAEVSAGIVMQPTIGGTIAPLHRDLRFDPGGPRYKDHLLFRWREGSPKKTAPTFFVRIDPTSLGFVCRLPLQPASG